MIKDTFRLDSTDTHFRLDAVRSISPGKMTPTGGLRLDGVITRSGIFEYRQPNGTVQREYRPPSEVTSEESLASLAGAVITVGHKRMVDPATWRADAVGHAGETARVEGTWIHTPLYIQDSTAIGQVQSGKLTGVSAGYRLDIDPTPGVTPEGEPYDCVQTNIRYNHIALIPAGTGRAGKQAGVRLDVDESYSPVDQMTLEQLQAALALLQTRFDALNSANGATLAEVASLRTALTTAEGARDAAIAGQTQARLDASDESVGKRVAARVTLQDVARTVSKDIRFDGRSDREIRCDALKVLDPKADMTGKDDSYVTAYFDGRVAGRGEAAVAKARVATTTVPPETRTDAATPEQSWSANAWRGTSDKPWTPGS